MKEQEEETLENNYENETREPVKLKSLLPIKTKDGIIRQTVVDEDENMNDDGIEMNENGIQNDVEGPLSEDEDFSLIEDSKFDLSKPILTAQLLAARTETLNEKKLQIGFLSANILENPEEKLSNLRVLLKMFDDVTPEVYLSVRKLVVVSLLEVFKDLLPSYQIKLQEKNKEVKCK